MQLAAAGHDVTAVDFSEQRLERLRENLARTELSVTLVEADILQWEPGRQFDVILLDAPCSATGTFRRHPEVLYRARPRIILDGRTAPPRDSLPHRSCPARAFDQRHGEQRPARGAQSLRGRN